MRSAGRIYADRELASAVFEVAREVLAAETSPTGVYPDHVVSPPPLEGNPALARLVGRGELDEAATLALRVLVLAEIDRGVHRVLRRLSAGEALAGTPVDGLITVLEGLGIDPVVALRALRPDQSLVGRGLVEIIDPGVPPLSQRVTVPTNIIDFVVTGEAPPPPPPFSVEVGRSLASLCPLPMREGREGEDADIHLRRVFDLGFERAPIWLVGVPGSGRRTLLAAVAAEQRKQLLCVGQADLQVLARRGGIVSRMWREVLLREAIICIHDAAPSVEVGGPEESVRNVTVDANLVALASTLVAARLPVVFCSSQSPPVHAFDHPLQVVHLAPARRADALALWQRDLPDSDAVLELASRFRLPPGRIVRAVDAARAQAESHGRPVSPADVTRAISVGVSQQVSVLGTLIEDTQTWDDIVLPAEPLESVRELVARVRHRTQVLDQWGFRGKLSKGLGVAALFHGPPGTGKTMVANLIARELHQDLYQVDLSRMVSKWIGETEKNLAKVFDAADGANVMLLFDEADSLFSKRTEVKSSNDRHSNAEVNYLLQRVERFEGVCILTTNLEKSIDAAFKRRLAFRVEFPMPDANERAELWRRMVPAMARVAPDVNFKVLAKNYELAGGNIRNALLRAAFLAADKGGAITMELLQRAVQLEYRDAGKLNAAGTIYAH